MESIEKHLRKAKTWNMVLFVLGIIGTISNLISLPETFNPTKATYDALGEYGAQSYEYVSSPFAKVYTVVSIVIGIALLVSYFLANKKLKEGKAPTKIPYFTKIAWTVIALVITFMTTPNVDYMGVNMARFTQYTAIGTSILISIPTIIVIVHLFKAEPEE
ncbi:hypothetical protein JZO70_07185 [Enterococcus sp. 669A]|uniref:Uncharacterized protein n=1 Tax=Candidatus Enterococcus moelleringii TaxID=2815325 RepID=A0ABS3L8I2_9ENTE|nr:hypothetical protein [Enterococcus sp. 669A]MBO1305937.1 hypothetical protein [Enterococcus sp. 669A]